MKLIHAKILGTIFGVLAIVVFLLLQGCVGLPTLEPTKTPAPMQGNITVTLPTETPASVGSLVTITGNVYLRDENDIRQGFLRQGAQVLAVCEGEWCVLDSTGLRFWRGCADDNPKGLQCLARR